MKRNTKDEYLQSVYRVIYYIEKHYAEELTVSSLSKVAGYSKYHFHRIFQSIIGESLGEYIRRVRLSHSINKLQSIKSITEVAIESGYETHASFAKAFKERFGLSPKDFSKKIKERKIEITIEPKIVNFKETKVICVRKEGDYMIVSDKAFDVIIDFANKSCLSHTKNPIEKKMLMFGVTYDNANITPINELRYDACITYDNQYIKPKAEVIAKVIEGGEHLYYLYIGTYEGISEIYNMMIQYTIENEMMVANKPSFEKYLNRHSEHTESEKLKTEIYIPIL